MPTELPDPFAQAFRLHQAGRFAEVVALVEHWAGPGEPTADLRNLAGVAAKRCGQREKAEHFYRQVLADAPEHTGALNNLAILLQENGGLDESESLYRKAIALAPKDVLPHLNLGNLYLAAKDFASAIAAYQTALALQPEMPEALRSLAEVYLAQGDPVTAEACLRRALASRPAYVDARVRLGDLCRESRRLAEALACYRQAVAQQPGRAPYLNRLGEVLQEMKQLPEAESLYRQALAVDANNPDVFNNLGILLHERKHYAESEAAYRQAIALRPEYAEAYNNLAVLVQKLKHFAAAETLYQKALALNPDYAAARCNYGLLCLTLGRFREGWPLYEARYAPERTVAFPKLSKPQWRGEPLAGKRLLIWNEQGLGDEIQFARYGQILKAQGAAGVGLVCKKPLTGLFATLEGIDTLHEEEQPFSVKSYDYWTFPLSIPHYLCPTPADIPASAAYLHADPTRIAAWAPRLAPGRKIGLVWKGRAEYSNDANRSLPDLRLLAPLWDLPGGTFYSLQKGEGEAEAANPPPGQPLVSLGPDFKDFMDTAAVVSQLDLVICVDTALAHLCGALGVPCWVMLPFVGTDWRWQLGRSDSPWYPSLRLFRQPAPDAWGPLVAELESACRAAWPEPAEKAGIDPLVAKIRRLSAVDRNMVENLIERLARTRAGAGA